MDFKFVFVLYVVVALGHCRRNESEVGNSDPRRKRTVGVILKNVADVFGYDVVKRPTTLGMKPPVNQPAPPPPPPMPPQPPAMPNPPQPSKTLQPPPPPPSMPPSPPPKSPQPPPTQPPPIPPQQPITYPPIRPPPLLTDVVRKSFNLNFSWNRGPQTPPPPAPPSMPPQPAPQAPPQPPPQASPPPPAPPKPPAPAANPPPKNPPPQPKPTAVPNPPPQKPPVGPPKQQPPKKLGKPCNYDDLELYQRNNQESGESDYDSDGPQRYELDLPDYEAEDREDTKRHIHPEPFENHFEDKRKFKENYDNFWQKSPLTIEKGYRYLTKPIITDDKRLDNFPRGFTRYQHTEESQNHPVVSHQSRIDHFNDGFSIYNFHDKQDYHNRLSKRSVNQNSETLKKRAIDSYLVYNLPKLAANNNLPQVVSKAFDTEKIYGPYREVNEHILKFLNRNKAPQAPNQMFDLERIYGPYRQVNQEILTFLHNKFANDAARIKQNLPPIEYRNIYEKQFLENYPLVGSLKNTENVDMNSNLEKETENRDVSGKMDNEDINDDIQEDIEKKENEEEDDDKAALKDDDAGEEVEEKEDLEDDEKGEVRNEQENEAEDEEANEQSENENYKNNYRNRHREKEANDEESDEDTSNLLKTRTREKEDGEHLFRNNIQNEEFSHEFIHPDGEESSDEDAKKRIKVESIDEEENDNYEDEEESANLENDEESSDNEELNEEAENQDEDDDEASSKQQESSNNEDLNGEAENEDEEVSPKQQNEESSNGDEILPKAEALTNNGNPGENFLSPILAYQPSLSANAESFQYFNPFGHHQEQLKKQEINDWIPIPNNPYELKHVEMFNPYQPPQNQKNREDDKENNGETLYTLIPAASVRQLYTSDKIITIPFDVEYSGSEKNQRIIKRSGNKQKPRKDVVANEKAPSFFGYIPEKYDESFNYEFPQPVSNYATLEKIEPDEDEEKLSPSATVIDNEYRKKKTTVILKKNVFIQ